MKIKILGGLVCPQRSLDIKKLENYFIQNGCVITKRHTNADVVVLMTCAFVERNIQESIKCIHLLKNSKKLIVAGCLQDKECLEKNFEGDVITTKEINKIDNLFPHFEHKFNSIPDANKMHNYGEIPQYIKDNNLKVEWDRDPHLHFVIRTSDGCDNKCSYCSHIAAIGHHKSKSIDVCVNEYHKGYNQGYRDFQLTAMNLGLYGTDLNTNFKILLQTLTDINHDTKFFLQNINPIDLVINFDIILDLCKQKRITEIDFAIQSGSKDILKKMNRYSDINKIEYCLKEFKMASEDIYLQNEIIIGFPSETDEDFNKTLQFIKNTNVDYSFAYIYYENDNMESKKYFLNVVMNKI